MKLTLVSLLALAASPALAGPSPQTANFVVSASVVKRCRVDTSGPLNLGTYDPSSTVPYAPSAHTTISVNCTKDTTFAIQPLTTANTFQMVNGSERLNYDLRHDDGATSWRTTGAGGLTTSANTALTFDVYGVIPPGQDPAEGSYQDTVTVTVTF